MADVENGIDQLVADVQSYADEWKSSVEHFREMTDKSFADATYPADEFVNDLATLSSNFWRDAARMFDASARAWALAARRAPSQQL